MTPTSVLSPIQKIRSRDNYAKILQKRLQFSYEIASSQAEKSASRHKVYYDSKVRASTIQEGDTVLIRNDGLKGKYKLADKWARDTYIVINQPNSEIPVFQVKKETGNEKIKTSQRNILLPISFIPILSEQSRIIQIPSQSVQNKYSPEKVTPIPDKTSKASTSSSISLNSSSECDSSDEDSDAGNVIPQRCANQGLGKYRSL